ncbi:MAG: Serine--tRNA ligase [Chloroflexi bacterium ADurb.Bin180]|nr:MAG: Serine--tRNA ligase [Chloroflexi bacterium ADurb.Bin180]
MLDLRLIREKPDFVKAAMASLGSDAPIDQILRLDERRRGILAEVELLKAQRNEVSKEIGRLRGGEGSEQLKEQSRTIGERIRALDEEVKDVEARLNAAMYEVPNIPHESVPPGKDDRENVVVRTVGEPRHFDFTPLAHWDLGPALGLIDFERGVRMSGTRFYLLKGMGARLQRALITWMLDLHVAKHGYTEIYPPYMVREDCLWVDGKLPKFRDNIYHDAEENLWWVGTAETPLTNLHRDETLLLADLPRNYVAYTACFRREKMSAGRDVRGIKRGHQFDKVEMFKFTTPESSYEELEKMVGQAEEVATLLGIPHRVILMCTGDLGFVAAKKYDVEMWAPGCGEWLEVSSISNCTDFQTRRGNMRFRREPGARPEYMHTLNGSGLALPRTLIAVMENYQQADGSVVVPEVLRPYMAGVDVIR